MESLESLIVQRPDGIGRADIEQEFASAHERRIAKRTLLRRLARLVAEGRIHATGDGPGTVYRPGPASIGEVPTSGPGELPLSREGAEARALVRRPLVERRPVGYRADFLREYEPGRTWYLSTRIRQGLHEAGRTAHAERPAGTYAREVLGRLLIDLSWASSRLEGNTYSRLDTQNLLEFGQRAEGKDASEAQMILNHKAAIELLVEETDRIGFDLLTFQSLHAALAENLLGDPADEGRLRRRVVDIGGTTYRPLAIPQQLEEHFRLLLEKADEIPDPFEQAFFVMVHVPYLQPFADVNKRTSRLGANIPLIKANLCPLSFVDVPERAYVEGILGVYELNRIELLRDVFVWAYERSCAQYRIVRESMGEPDPLRLRYRDELTSLVREMVQGGAPPERSALRAWAEAHGVPRADVGPFTDLALTLLLGLHEGALHRYRIRPSEFQVWRARHALQERHR